MKRVSSIFALSALTLLSACSSTPDRGAGDVGSDPEVNSDTAPGLDGVEVISATSQTDPSAQNINGQLLEGQSIDEMKLQEVDGVNQPIIYFGYDQYSIDDAGTATVRYFADMLNANTGKKVILQGHTDERGTPEYNLALSEKRAKAVSQAMMLFGVDQKRIEVVSFGEEQPIDNASSESAWRKNRRVEILIK
jgi:peptidoglycan-associated lipoprotein